MLAMSRESPPPIPRRSGGLGVWRSWQGGVTEAMRWEEDEWEIFVGDGPNIPEDELRKVPLGTLVGADESLLAVVNLAIGEGLLRDDPDSEWRPWPNRKRTIQ